jgi:hypothetical protein
MELAALHVLVYWIFGIVGIGFPKFSSFVENIKNDMH